MGNIFDRQMSDVSIAMLESSLKKSNESLSADITDVVDRVNSLIDVFYPVGSYYDTSDTSFDPNVAWGGTWELESGGLVHVSAGNSYVAGTSGGEAQHTLTDAEVAMPSHTHTFTLPTVEDGGSEYTEYDGDHIHVPSGSYNYYAVTNATEIKRRSIHDGASGNTLFTYNLYADDVVKLVGSTSSGGNHRHAISLHSHELTDGAINNAQKSSASSAISMMQPYVVVNRWHRTG